MLCKYKHIFGKEGEGLHSIRIFNIAIIDVIGTVLLAFVISNYFKTNLWITMISLFVIAIILHRVFCVNTTVNKLIFGSI